MATETEKSQYSFGLSWPYFFQDVFYMWPSEDLDEIKILDKRLKDRREGLEYPLLEETKKSMQAVRMDVSYYPHSEIGRECLTFHIFSGGEWFSLGGMLGDYFVSTHNIDGTIGKMVAFNVAAKALELLIPGFAAPRWARRDENAKAHFSERRFDLIYPLPESASFPVKSIRGREKVIEGILKLSALNTRFNIEEKENNMSIIIPDGRVNFIPGLCTAGGFAPIKLGQASYLTSCLCAMASGC